MISLQNRSRSEVDALADAVGDMFCAYLLDRAAKPARTK
jgi:hypothetical protein